MLIPARRSPETRRRVRVPRSLAYLLAFLALPVIAGGLTVRSQLASPDPAPAIEGALPAPPMHDPGKLTAVILAGSTGAESIDLLAPYEVLSTSGAFNVYTLAPERRVLPLFPATPQLQGTHFVPHYSFDGFANAVGVEPDLIVVPWIPFPDALGNEPLLSWMREHVTSETVLLTICGGSWTAAQAGLLDGYAATTHRNIFPIVKRDHAETTWITGRRWVHDRNVISSAGITASIDATLHAISQLAGRDLAEDVALRLAYPHVDFLDDPRYDVPLPDKRLRMLNLAYRWDTTDIGLVLYDGVGEIDVAAVVDLYPRTYSNVVHPIALTDGIVETRHGLHLVPRHSADEAARVNRVVLPGRASAVTWADVDRWATGRGLTVETLDQDAFPFDASLGDLAAHESRAVARLVASGIEYPLNDTTGTGRDWPWDVALRPLALGLAGMLSLAVVRRRRRSADRVTARSSQGTDRVDSGVA